MVFYEPPEPLYRDRQHAGSVLAERLEEFKIDDMAILAIPNGGVPVAIPIAIKLEAPLFLMIVRKLQFPDNPEAGFGALTSDGFLLLNERLVEYSGLTKADIEMQKKKAMASINKRLQFFGKWSQVDSLKDRSVVLVDDGLASGFTMLAAVRSARSQEARRIIVAVPTSSMSAFRRLEKEVDRVVCPHVSRLPVFAVADAYENWYDVDESEVRQMLEELERAK
ncbi:MAG: phosphoribosyltransferase [Deltaproteobacteria bacterium]|nr:MAG: phosphoribosyltransferase [Deltaproteobacteria bacterium]